MDNLLLAIKEKLSKSGAALKTGSNQSVIEDDAAIQGIPEFIDIASQQSL